MKTQTNTQPNRPGFSHPLPLSIAALLAVACATAPTKEEQRLLDTPSPAQAANEKLKTALAAPHRSAENKARDKYRHPLTTLAFFGLQDNHTVLEMFPGPGWYTEVLAPVLRDNGKLLVTSADPNGDPEDYQVKRAKELDALVATHPAVFDNLGKVIIDSKDVKLGAPGTVDMVLVFRSLHGWVQGGTADKILSEIFAVLKPGGTLGIEGHRGKEGTPLDGGYMPESMAIELVKRAGFELAEKAEINANPKDTKDHPKGVWTLPPSYALGDQDREKYTAIGESDRFTLRFVKPAR